MSTEQELKLSKDELVNKIINIMRLEGEHFTDGDCLDLIAELLERQGYQPFPDGFVETTEDSL